MPKWLRIELLTLILLGSSCSAAPAFVAATSTPVDNGTNLGPTVSIVPPSMQAGDLVLVFVQYKDAAGTITVQDGNDGGQAWSFVRQSNQSNVRARVFWCQFNGSWKNNPVFAVDNTDRAAMSAVMLVFRPTASTMFWMVDVFPRSTTFAAPQFPFPVTIAGITTLKPSTVSVASWFDSSATSWGNLTGAGWSKTGLAPQYRNGGGASASFAYQIKSSAGETSPVAQNQDAAQAGSSYIMSFAEITLPTGGSGTSGLVQEAAVSESSGSTFNLKTFERGPVGLGHAVIGYSFFEVADPRDAGFLTPITDDKGNEYIPIQVVTDDSLTQTAVSFFCLNITNQPTTVTMRLSVQEQFRGMVLHEVSGITALDTYSGAFHAAVDAFQPAIFATPAVTPSTNGEYLFGAIHCTGSISPCGAQFPLFTAMENWTKESETLGDNVNVASFDLIQSSAAAVQFRTQGTDVNADLLMATFKPANGGGPRTVNVSLIASSNPIAPNQSLTLTATVTPTSVSGAAPSGTITFESDGLPLGSSVLQAGSASLTTAFATLNPIPHQLLAVYSGDTNYLGSNSSSVGLVVGYQTNISAQIPSSALAGGTIVLTALVSSPFGTPTGEVAFNETDHSLGIAQLANGISILNLTGLAVGTHSITAAYGGDSSFFSSSSSPMSLLVRYPTNISLQAPPNAVAGPAIAISVAVSSLNGTPTGTVVLNEGDHSLASAQLVNGSATLALPGLGAGVHSLSVNYSGDTLFSQATSSVQLSVAPDFILSITPQSLETHAGQSPSATITVASQPGGFIAPIQLSCSGAPPLSTCAVSPNSVIPGTGMTTATLTLSTVAGLAMLGRGLTSQLAFCLPPICFLFVVPFPSSRLKLRLRSIAVVSLLLVTVCCGGGHSPISSVGTPQGTYTLTVAASSGTAQHILTVTLTVR